MSTHDSLIKCLLILRKNKFHVVKPNKDWKAILKPLSILHAELVATAIKSAQSAGDLPEFELPKLSISAPKNPDHGDYSFVTMSLTRLAKSKPLDIANAIIKHLPEAEYLGEAYVIPPGFINFRLNDDWLRKQVEIVIANADTFGRIDNGKGQRAQVEFLSANPTGPITIGRARGAILGDAIARILEAGGYEVEREYYFNDAGMQMQNLGESLRVRYLQELGIDTEVQDKEKFYQGEYLIDFAKELVADKGKDWVEEDWKPFKEYAKEQMFGWIKTTLDRIGIKHDVFFSEQSLYENNAVWDTLEQLKEKDYIYSSTVRESESDEVKEANKHLKPAQWFRSTQVGDNEDRVVVKSNDEPTYTLPDIAYHKDKVDRGFDLLVNVLGSDHQTEARVVKYGLEAIGYRHDHLHVIFMQMIRAVKDGKEVKMSTRRGVYDTLDELIDLTSADAVRYFLMQRSPDSKIDFDIDLAVKQSNENPVYYIQYALVRCAGILREAEARNFTDDGADLSLLAEEELKYIRKILEFNEALNTAVEQLTPHTIAFYALDLANTFHPMYDKVRVFGEGIPDDIAKARLRFYKATKIAFNRVLLLLGMSTPERM